MRTYRYLHLDVFTNRPLQGNQLAVFPDAANLEPVLMQSIALEMAFSETTFVLPPETSDTHARVRIFTPRDEIPMAGHPTIGTTFALAHEGTLAPEQKSITLGLGIGPTLVRLEWKAGRLHFAWMTQPIPEFGAIPANTGDLAAALGIKEADIRDTGLPVQVASSGLPFLKAARSRLSAAVIIESRPMIPRVNCCGSSSPAVQCGALPPPLTENGRQPPARIANFIC